MPFTFLIELLYKFKKELFVALAVITLVGGGYWYHTSAVSHAFSTGLRTGMDSVYALVAVAPPETVKTITTRWYSLPKDTVQGKPETTYVATNLDSLTVDSLKTLVHKIETPYTTVSNDSMMNLTIKAVPMSRSLIFLERKYKCIDTTNNIKKTLVKDFDGLNFGITGTINVLGQTSIGASYRYKQILFGPSYQILGPSPETWYNRAQINISVFLD